ncbi:hypothetical protein A9264_13610 [Vibrio sp. UCD-FRSSP16_10]|nr:hypothetical protein A9260_13825 [Vibrio sp. UCD-FRSSP16_30]OBT20097.1 hypothetical protein A9264_13610 [Vibrio sp. UCD-FRSSP16_10]
METDEFFPSMVKNKTTSKPTARWVFLKFEGIDTLEFGGQSFTQAFKSIKVDCSSFLAGYMKQFIPKLAAESRLITI